MPCVSDMRTADGRLVPLKRLDWRMEAEGFVLRAVLRQTFRNESAATEEIVYTFELPWESTVTGFAALVNGQRFEARAFPRRGAELLYEETLSQGDVPMLLTCDKTGRLGLFVAGVRPNDTIEIEIRLTEMLREQGGEVRLSVPTTISRRASGSSRWGMDPCSVSEPNALASYPVSASIRLTGGLEKGTVSTPGHDAVFRRTENEVLIELSRAYADRDITVVVSRAALGPVLYCETKDGETAAVLSFTPRTSRDPAEPVELPEALPARQGRLRPDKHPEAPHRPLNLRVLADCSGSMAGRPIEQLKAALRALEFCLYSDERLSLWHFGDWAETIIRTGRRCSKLFFRLAWPTAVSRMAPYQGTSRLERAIEAAAKEGCDILLITDADVPDVWEAVSAAHKAQSRIFSLGLGWAPGRALLSRISDVSGGCFATVTPEEPVAGAVGWLVRQMRLEPRRLEVSWPKDALWQGPVPACATVLRTVHCAAFFKRKPPLPGLSCDGESMGVMRREVDAGILPVAAKAWTETLEEAREREKMAVRCGLLTHDAALLMTAERPRGDKASPDPVVVRVPQMPAGAARLMRRRRIRERSLPGSMACFDLSTPEPYASVESLLDGIHSWAPSKREIARAAGILRDRGLYWVKFSDEENFAHAIFMLIRVKRFSVDQFPPEFLGWMTDIMGPIMEDPSFTGNLWWEEHIFSLAA